MTLYSLGATTVAGYRIRTGDNSTPGTLVTGALVEAEALLEEELRRRLPLEERTSSFRLWPDGLIYPDAWPIVDAELTIRGRALVGGTPDLEEWVGWIGTDRSCTPVQATVTWTGGFDESTLPVTLKLAIYDAARAATSLTPAIPGAVSASLGDASVTYASPSAGALDSLVPGLSARVSRYRNRFV